MTIDKKRIRVMPKQLQALPEGEEIRIIIRTALASESRSPGQIGFSEMPSSGQTVLPRRIGPATKRNADGYFIVHKDQDKVSRSFELVTRRSQFCGRDQREIVEDYHSYSRMCYPRTFVHPLGLELTYFEPEDRNAYYGSSLFQKGYDDNSIIAAINVFLELFGCCEIVGANSSSIPQVRIQRVNWELLPQGEGVPAVESFEPLVNSMRNSAHRTVAKRQLSALHRYAPTALAVGCGGFNGYVAFLYEDRGVTVLESIEPNNATYIFDGNWEEVSQLSKLQIVQDELCLERVIHSSSWGANMHRIFHERRAA